MRIVDGKIIEATEDELFSYWLSRGYDDIMSFPQFIMAMINNGVIVLKDS
jgi:hypothetical protein